ncbi:NAD(P)H-dependent oxidoreductase [Streptomyces sp. ME19-01-6]|uniref:NAD(P)H-dependent oxidoreductase n=1 Tax=Streptomyces sp. ME19-01-6 TaxID=3028686 RepID=UPI0029AA7594|nr:NAD(P)H-dependent oxidoreductase [Streptomyces sp. ME19-01-6]MDX3233021.1 NAD(P)H-dependent oxidoreductase [Streptomyces sp. ME19-01-6]
MHTLLVIAHPRSSSLTAQVAARACERLEADGGTVDVRDLHAEGFDPRMTPEDEPDFDEPGKVCSPEVRALTRRIGAADEIVMVSPVWLYGLPALLKGWIDRVWNHGFAYGMRTHVPAHRQSRPVARPGGHPGARLHPQRCARTARTATDRRHLLLSGV